MIDGTVPLKSLFNSQKSCSWKFIDQFDAKLKYLISFHEHQQTPNSKSRELCKRKKEPKRKNLIFVLFRRFPFWNMKSMKMDILIGCPTFSSIAFQKRKTKQVKRKWTEINYHWHLFWTFIHAILFSNSINCCAFVRWYCTAHCICSHIWTILANWKMNISSATVKY